jgi:RimJ/RimL family protein N-acetyltransferase
MPKCEPFPAAVGAVRAEAREGDRVVGRLEGEVLHPNVFALSRLEVEPGQDADGVRDAFARALAAGFARAGAEASVWERPDDAPWQAALERAGFAVAHRKEYVERSLDRDLPPTREGFATRSLAEAGRSAFTARMIEASRGDPFEDEPDAERDYDREWDDLVAYAGARLRPERWLLVDDARGPVGVVLPQTFADGRGTLFYVGVVPARRGEGFGTALHALGLRLLADQGVRQYVGSTDLRNEPMRRVFARNGCRHKGVRVLLTLPARPS